MHSELIPVTATWKSIGAALRLKASTLNAIESSSSGDHSACLASVVEEWLKRNYNVMRFGEPTWQRLVEAVAHPAGGANPGLARDIARRHKAGGMSNRSIYCILGRFYIFVIKWEHAPLVPRPLLYVI